mmetsp:Transcript_81069/g.250197  ORF Transcript_81069/g.250197 Transcript_81069/m.250197 type:complete len:350 (-) Transcript_81069:873-1922(-)
MPASLLGEQVRTALHLAGRLQVKRVRTGLQLAGRLRWMRLRAALPLAGRLREVRLRIAVPGAGRLAERRLLCGTAPLRLHLVSPAVVRGGADTQRVEVEEQLADLVQLRFRKVHGTLAHHGVGAVQSGQRGLRHGPRLARTVEETPRSGELGSALFLPLLRLAQGVDRDLRRLVPRLPLALKVCYLLPEIGEVLPEELLAVFDALLRELVAVHDLPPQCILQAMSQRLLCAEFLQEPDYRFNGPVSRAPVLACPNTSLEGLQLFGEDLLELCPLLHPLRILGLDAASLLRRHLHGFLRFGNTPVSLLHLRLLGVASLVGNRRALLGGIQRSCGDGLLLRQARHPLLRNL